MQNLLDGSNSWDELKEACSDATDADQAEGYYFDGISKGEMAHFDKKNNTTGCVCSVRAFN